MVIPGRACQCVQREFEDWGVLVPKQLDDQFRIELRLIDSEQPKSELAAEIPGMNSRNFT
jgi:hypothetical protein